MEVSEYMIIAIKQKTCSFYGLTALESWCLACIAFVFQARISYVIILAKLGCSRNNRSAKVEEEEIKMNSHLQEKINVMLEWILFSWVFGSAFIFNLYYSTKERDLM